MIDTLLKLVKHKRCPLCGGWDDGLNGGKRMIEHIKAYWYIHLMLALAGAQFGYCLASLL